jgi:hypothetical protein
LPVPNGAPTVGSFGYSFKSCSTSYCSSAFPTTGMSDGVKFESRSMRALSFVVNCGAVMNAVPSSLLQPVMNGILDQFPLASLSEPASGYTPLGPSNVGKNAYCSVGSVETAMPVAAMSSLVLSDAR